MHNVGLFVSHAAHHKHSYYVIRNSDRLLGFTQREVEIIALVARYHRKSAPKQDHREFMAVSEQDRAWVRVLAGILRVAIALDRTRSRAVEHVTCEVGRREVVVELAVAPDADASLEVFTAEQRVGLLEEALLRRVRFEVGSA